MQPTAAPWARPPGAAAAAPSSAVGEPLPAASRGEHTKAPWAAVSGPALTGRPVEAAVAAEPALPAPTAAEWGAHAFVPACKRITSPEDLRRFLRGRSVQEFVGFLLALNEAVKGRALSDACTVSPAMEALVGVLNTLDAWVDEIPPAAHALRYGNPAYRVWFARVAAEAPALLARVLPPDLAPAIVELAPYLVDSFGNATRIDYGTGHETTFCALLFCLARLGVLGADDCQAAVTRVYWRYLRLMRRVQTTYWLEPAGSHGVWGLDDYQFMPFLWGSAQLVDHPFLKPGSIHSAEVLASYSDDFLYIGAVAFVRRVKKGPLQETSPMLNDISGLPSWRKINQGMVKMYQAEVLGKFPIMQHFLFGSLLPADLDPPPQQAPQQAAAAAAAAQQEPEPPLGSAAG